MNRFGLYGITLRVREAFYTTIFAKNAKEWEIGRFLSLRIPFSFPASSCVGARRAVSSWKRAVTPFFRDACHETSLPWFVPVPRHLSAPGSEHRPGQSKL